MLFSKKKDLLEYKWKNPNDNKLVDRWILQWKVVVVDGMYEWVDKDEIIEELRNKVAELEGKIAWFKESNWDLEELKVNCEYYKNEWIKYAKYCSDVVDVCYKKIKAVMWSRFTEDKETFKEWIQRMVKWEE